MTKKYEIVEYPSGVCTDPNVVKAPFGALKVCENAAIRRDGILEPFMGFDGVTIDIASSLTLIHRMIPYDGDLLLFDLDAEFIEWLSSLGTEILNEDSAYPALYNEHIRHVIAKNNLYLATEEGTKKFTSGASQFNKAGILPDFTLYLSEGSGVASYIEWLDAGNTVAYKATISREDANGLEVESAPTGAFQLTPTGGVTFYVDVTAYFGDDVQEGDKINIYRTKQQTASVGPNEYLAYLVTSYEVSSADITAGSAQIVDVTDDNALGKDLYTNSTRHGSENRNDPPPTAKEIAYFNGSMFFGNVSFPHQLKFRMNNSTGSLAGETVGAGTRLVTGNYTNGSDQVTSISDTAGIVLGQKIIAPGYTQTGTFIEEINGSTITMTKTAAATTTGASTYVYDSIFLGTIDDHYVLNPAITKHSAINLVYDIYSDTDSDIVASFIEMAKIASFTTSVNTVVLKKKKMIDPAFSVWATHGESYDPPLNGPTSFGGTDFVLPTANLTSEQEEYPDWLMWSRNGMPEHVPFANSISISSGVEIHRIIPTMDALFTFTDEGIFTSSGFSADSGFVHEQLSPSYVLLRPDLCCVAKDAIYAVTNRGLVRVTSQGVQEISSLYIHEDIKEQMNELYANKDTESLGNWIIYSEKWDELYISLAGNAAYTGYLWVYSLKTKNFYKRDFESSDIYYLTQQTSDDYSLYYACDDIAKSGYFLFKENAIPSGTNERSLTIASKPDSITINFTTDHNASVGDFINDENYYQEILTIVDSDTVTVADSSLITGSVKIYTPIEVRVTWLPKFGDTRALRKLFHCGSFIFQDTDYLTTIRISFDGGVTYYDIAVNNNTIRYEMPIAYARELELEPTVILRQPNQSWELTGLSLEYTSQKPRGVKY